MYFFKLGLIKCIFQILGEVLVGKEKKTEGKKKVSFLTPSDRVIEKWDREEQGQQLGSLPFPFLPPAPFDAI